MNTLETILAVVFWTCAGLVVYAYLGYPAMIAGLARWFGRAITPPVIPLKDLPSLSLLIAAHNEEAVIAKRIENALQLDYPSERYEIVVASDGSTDNTATIVRRYADRGVRLLTFRQRRGKAAVLNAAVPELHGAIILFSDANTNLDRAAARHLARWFADPQVGGVCGQLVLIDPANGCNADGLYWRMENFLKRCEARLDALVGANGAIYALRRDCYVPVPDGTIVDDLVLPLLARLRKGCRLHYESDALAFEETAADLRGEFRRRCRIGTGAFQSLALLAPLLHPRHGWLAFAFVSHKLLRWCCPFFLLGLFLTSLALVPHPLYRSALLAQLGGYAASLLIAWMPGQLTFLKPLRLAAMFTSMNAALLVGFGRWLRGGRLGTWQPTQRLSQVQEVPL